MSAKYFENNLLPTSESKLESYGNLQNLTSKTPLKIIFKNILKAYDFVLELRFHLKNAVSQYKIMFLFYIKSKIE